jgi:tetratricopeptide (TPR) repeat protein
MPSYLWTGKDRFGNPTVHRITAETVEQSKQFLIASGCTDLQLQWDEVMATVHEKNAAVAAISADDLFRFQQKGRVTVREVFKTSFAPAKGILLVLGLLIAWGIYSGQTWVIALSVAGILVFPAINFWFAQSSLYYTKLNKARVWARWQEVIAYVESLKRVKRWTKIGVPEAELARARAQAFAGMGHLDDALREFEPFCDTPGMPRWLYFSLLAGIYEIARRPDEALKFTQQALECGPQNSTSWISYSHALVRFKHDPVQARLALEKAEQLEIADMARPFVALCHGLIAREEVRHTAAKDKLEEALRGFLQRSQHDLIEGNILLTKAYLITVYAALGNNSLAQQFLSETKDFLTAHKEVELLAECARAAGCAEQPESDRS